MVCRPSWSTLLYWMSISAPGVFLSWCPNPLNNGTYWCQSAVEKGQLFISNYQGPFRVMCVNCNPKHSHRAIATQTSKSSENGTYLCSLHSNKTVGWWGYSLFRLLVGRWKHTLTQPNMYRSFGSLASSLDMKSFQSYRHSEASMSPQPT